MNRSVQREEPGQAAARWWRIGSASTGRRSREDYAREGYQNWQHDGVERHIYVDRAAGCRALAVQDTGEAHEASASRRRDRDIRVSYGWWIARQLWDRRACYEACTVWVLKDRARLCVRWTRSPVSLRKCDESVGRQYAGHEHERFDADWLRGARRTKLTGGPWLDDGFAGSEWRAKTRATWESGIDGLV
jgi:hypothetical protein